MLPKERRHTGYCDRNGTPLYENDRCKSWRKDDLHPAGGFWLVEVIKLYKRDWYLFEENHLYKDSDDRPVLLSEFNKEIQFCGLEMTTQ